MSVQQDKFKEIADAIRGKTNSTDKIKPSEFASKVNDVYEAGKKAQSDEYQTKGMTSANAHLDEKFTFAGPFWTDDTFNPNMSWQPRIAEGAFRSCYIKNLKGILERNGVTFDFSKCINMDYFTYYCKLEKFPLIDLTGVTRALSYSFAGLTGSNVELPIKLKADGSNTFSNTFGGSSGLVTLTIEGVIGQNGFNVSQCTNLSHDSLMSIINHLKDGVSSLTVTLGSTNLAKLTDAEKAIATQKGWTLA